MKFQTTTRPLRDLVQEPSTSAILWPQFQRDFVCVRSRFKISSTRCSRVLRSAASYSVGSALIQSGNGVKEAPMGYDASDTSP